jgi:ribosomal protein L19E
VFRKGNFEMIGSKRARSYLKDYYLEDVRTIFQETNQSLDDISVKSRYFEYFYKDIRCPHLA